MNKENLFRYILGYFVGISIFGVLIPWGLISFCQGKTLVSNISIIDNKIIQFLIFAPLLLSGLFFAIWSNIALFRVGKGGPADGFNLALSPRTKNLVISGPYKYSRNPMVFGAYLAYFSIGIYYNSFPCMVLLMIFFLLTILYLKMTEEKRLLKDFGDEFIRYRKNVPMIIPFTKIKKNGLWIRQQ